MKYDEDLLKVAMDPATRNELMDWSKYEI